MTATNVTHLRNLAAARAVLSLLATTDDGGVAVSSVLAADENSAELAGVTLDQRMRFIDVVDGDADAGAAADEISNMIVVNHREDPLVAAAANIDLVRLLRLILATTDVDYRLLERNLRVASDQERATAAALIRLGNIRYMVKDIVDLLGPVDAGADADHHRIAAE